MRYVLCAAAIIAALLLACGCKDNDKGGTCCFCGEEWGPASVQIVMYVDTLRYLPGESVCAQGFIVAKDAQQRAMPGVKINVELTEPFGSIELLNSALQDTTNALGRVEFRFCCDGCTGDNVIHAWYGSHEDTWPIHVAPATTPLCSATFSIDQSPYPITVDDSVTIGLTVSDSLHHFTDSTGLQATVAWTGGHWTPFPPLNSNLDLQSIWYPDAVGTFMCRLSLTCGGHTDRDSFEVRVCPAGGPTP